MHINEISNKIAKNVGILSRIAYLLPQSVKLNLYYALIYPYLSYCNLIWAMTYPSRLIRLVIIQKRAIRLIAGVRKWAHTAPLFRELKILRIDQIRDFQVGEFFFRLEHGLLPPIFKDFLPHAYDIHSHYTRNASTYRSVGSFQRWAPYSQVSGDTDMECNPFQLYACLIICSSLKKDYVHTFFYLYNIYTLP